ncbi:MAG: hypothetical protein K5989_08475 [Lachnospiraceae bacterium]|nr:hypothetical protein [Lachnospiraceae bacterium]
MIFSKQLYVGAIASKRIGKIKWKLRHGAGMAGTYCITLPSHGSDLLEIYHSGVLKQSYFKDYPPEVVGLAWGYWEALTVVQEILKDVQASTGSFDVRNYFAEEKGKRSRVRVCAG